MSLSRAEQSVRGASFICTETSVHGRFAGSSSRARSNSGLKYS